MKIGAGFKQHTNEIRSHDVTSNGHLFLENSIQYKNSIERQRPTS